MTDNPYVEEDGYQNTRLAIEAISHMTEEQYDRLDASDRDGNDTRDSRYHRCSECGQGGYSGQYPFSTIPDGDTCDDCL